MNCMPVFHHTGNLYIFIYLFVIFTLTITFATEMKTFLLLSCSNENNFSELGMLKCLTFTEKQRINMYIAYKIKSLSRRSILNYYMHSQRVLKVLQGCIVYTADTFCQANARNRKKTHENRQYTMNLWIFIES